MDAVDVVMIVEGDFLPDGVTPEDLMEGIRQHADTLRRLQGSWGRFIESLEEAGEL